MSQEGHPPTPEPPSPNPGYRWLCIGIGAVIGAILSLAIAPDADAADEDRVWIETT